MFLEHSPSQAISRELQASSLIHIFGLSLPFGQQVRPLIESSIEVNDHGRTYLSYRDWSHLVMQSACDRMSLDSAKLHAPDARFKTTSSRSLILEDLERRVMPRKSIGGTLINEIASSSVSDKRDVTLVVPAHVLGVLDMVRKFNVSSMGGDD
jgi:hypothetical protein